LNRSCIDLFHSSTARIDRTIFAFNTRGTVINCSGIQIELTCCDLYGNSGEWPVCIADQENVHGNFTGDPEFCAPTEEDFTLAANSPCLPGNHPTGANCGLIGAFAEGCQPTLVESTTWGVIKALYRR
jgi:hypothetical protein